MPPYIISRDKESLYWFEYKPGETYLCCEGILHEVNLTNALCLDSKKEGIVIISNFLVKDKVIEFKQHSHQEILMTLLRRKHNFFMNRAQFEQIYRTIRDIDQAMDLR